MKIKSKKKKGFTLIELVIVLAVLAIIALIAIPNFTKVRQDSLKKADIESCNQIEKITLMAIANEDITYSGTGNNIISITFNNGVLVEPTVGVANSTLKTTAGLTITIKAADTGSDTNYKQLLKDIKIPQYNNGSKYIVTIDDQGGVEVATDKITKDGADIS